MDDLTKSNFVCRGKRELNNLLKAIKEYHGLQLVVRESSVDSGIVLISGKKFESEDLENPVLCDFGDGLDRASIFFVGGL